MTKARSLWLIASISLSALGAAFYAGKRVQAAAQYKGQVQVVVESLTVLDTVYLTDTLRLTKWRTRYDTLVETRDIHDTAWVKEFVLVADTTIKICTAALRTCEARVALQAKRADLAEQQLKDLGGMQDSKAKRNLWIGLGLGALGGLLLAR